jgi:hypothetical protein
MHETSPCQFCLRKKICCLKAMCLGTIPIGDGGDESLDTVPVRLDASLQGLAQVFDGAVAQFFKSCAYAAEMSVRLHSGSFNQTGNNFDQIYFLSGIGKE